jgi:hypothetical protein
MVVSTKTWKEKRIEKEEKSDDSDNNSLSKGDENQGNVEINTVFHFPAEFSLPKPEGDLRETSKARETHEVAVH